MRAEVIGLGGGRFEVEPEAGSLPDRVNITLRPCWQKPPMRLSLAFAYQEGGVAYYEIVEQS